MDDRICLASHDGNPSSFQLVSTDPAHRLVGSRPGDEQMLSRMQVFPAAFPRRSPTAPLNGLYSIHLSRRVPADALVLAASPFCGGDVRRRIQQLTFFVTRLLEDVPVQRY